MNDNYYLIIIDHVYVVVKMNTSSHRATTASKPLISQWLPLFTTLLITL